MRPLALGQKNYLFVGSLEGGRRATIVYTLVGIAKLSGWDPQANLHGLLDRIAAHPINRIGERAPGTCGSIQPELRQTTIAAALGGRLRPVRYRCGSMPLSFAASIKVATAAGLGAFVGPGEYCVLAPEHQGLPARPTVLVFEFDPAVLGEPQQALTMVQ